MDQPPQFQSPPNLQLRSPCHSKETAQASDALSLLMGSPSHREVLLVHGFMTLMTSWPKDLIVFGCYVTDRTDHWVIFRMIGAPVPLFVHIITSKFGFLGWNSPPSQSSDVLGPVGSSTSTRHQPQKTHDFWWEIPQNYDLNQVSSPKWACIWWSLFLKGKLQRCTMTNFFATRLKRFEKNTTHTQNTHWQIPTELFTDFFGEDLFECGLFPNHEHLFQPKKK